MKSFLNFIKFLGHFFIGFGLYYFVYIVFTGDFDARLLIVMIFSGLLMGFTALYGDSHRKSIVMKALKMFNIPTTEESDK